MPGPHCPLGKEPPPNTYLDLPDPEVTCSQCSSLTCAQGNPHTLLKGYAMLQQHPQTTSQGVMGSHSTGPHKASLPALGLSSSMLPPSWFPFRCSQCILLPHTLPHSTFHMPTTPQQGVPLPDRAPSSLHLLCVCAAAPSLQEGVTSLLHAGFETLLSSHRGHGKVRWEQK